MADSYKESMRKVVSAEYQEISNALTAIFKQLESIEEHLKRLNSKTISHGLAIEDINKWIAVHEAIQKELKKFEDKNKENSKEKIKNTIALAGLGFMIIFQLVDKIFFG